jgi:SPP1 family predicted phage head-tail adaptor
MPKPQSPWPSINPGELRHRVQIQQESTLPDSFGQPQSTWTTVLTTWARIRAASQREQFQANALVAQITHTITMRYQSAVAIAPGMRILFGSRIFTIQVPVNVEERNVLIDVMCLEEFPKS